MQEYYELEECMGEADRKWSKCQAQVTALKVCHQAQKNQQTKNSFSSPVSPLSHRRTEK